MHMIKHRLFSSDIHNPDVVQLALGKISRVFLKYTLNSIHYQGEPNKNIFFFILWLV